MTLSFSISWDRSSFEWLTRTLKQKERKTAAALKQETIWNWNWETQWTYNSETFKHQFNEDLWACRFENKGLFTNCLVYRHKWLNFVNNIFKSLWSTCKEIRPWQPLKSFTSDPWDWSHDSKLEFCSRRVRCQVRKLAKLMATIMIKNGSSYGSKSKSLQQNLNLYYHPA